MKTYQNFINGQWIKARSGECMDVYNPATEELIAQVAKSGHVDVDTAVNAARDAFSTWKDTDIKERVNYIDKIYQELMNRREQLAEMITLELGVPISFSRTGQVDLALNEIRATLEEVIDYPFEEKVDTAQVIKEPYGVVACITPWNYPLNQIQRKITPALLAGNTVVVKPASNTPLTALLYAEIIEAAGLPDGVFNVVTGSGSEVGDYLAGHPQVDVISFTGSTEVGRNLYKPASTTVKKLVLELGGKSAMVYLPGGDLALAVKKSMNTILNNQGQTCSAMSRLLVPKDQLDETKALIKAYYDENVIIGDPMEEKTTIGPMVSKSQLETVHQYIDQGKNEGANIFLGGNILERPGHYIAPTVFTEVRNDMTIAQEEIFGPVLCVIAYETVDEAVRIANDSPYGLSGGVVGPQEQALKVARQLRTGNVFVNDGPRSPKAPFGGYKQSGLGRENGIYGLEDYLELKALFI